MYAFVTLPLRASRRAQANKGYEDRLSAKERNEAQTLRTACLRTLETAARWLRAASGGSNGALDGNVATEALRQQAVQTWLGSVEQYAESLIGLVTRVPVAAMAYFYHWGSSLEEEQENIYDDYRYDLLGVYYNLATLLLNLAHRTVNGKSGTPDNTQEAEKEAYRTLLSSAGYFALSRELMQGIKAQPIGAVGYLPYFASLERCIRLAELIALAQAQEIGTRRAAAADAKDGTDTACRLAHQLYNLYTEADGMDLSRYTATPSKEYKALRDVIRVKREVSRALMYSHGAGWLFATDQPRSLQLLEGAKAQVNLLRSYLSDEQHKKKEKAGVSLVPYLQDSLAALKKREERLTTLNTLVHHAKPAPGPLTLALLPPAQVLAVSATVSLPLRLPPPPPPPALPSAAALTPSSPPQPLPAGALHAEEQQGGAASDRDSRHVQ